jgi:cell division protease FtsH
LTFYPFYVKINSGKLFNGLKELVDIFKLFDRKEAKMNTNLVRNIVIWTIIATVLMFAFSNFKPQAPPDRKEYTEFIQDLEAGKIQKLEKQGSILNVLTKGDVKYKVYAMADPHFIDDLLAHGVKAKEIEPEQPSMLTQLLISFGPMLLLIAVWIFFMRQMQSGGAGGRGATGFGKSKARLLEEDNLKVTFADVAGCDEAKEEVEEVVGFLRDPAKYQKLGGTVPRGVLMIGPPGTGKTLLARAIAGEAKVPFFTISGSDFVEMFVGVGASRVRDMFEQAKAKAPCIIFIDELDAVGRQRGAGLGGGNDEREQTLNQLLVEMDGFEGNEGIIVIAATNRVDVLDKALLRPGRFDRQVTVGLPDVKGREQILGVHLKKVPVANDVEVKYIAQGTPGFSGADLKNLVNEAALFAARFNQKTVTMANLEKAKDKTLMGAERHTMVMDPDELKQTAYHEAGHCIVGRIVPQHDPVYKVSIMPRGRALGITMFLPERDMYSMSKKKLDSMLSSLYGGRIAEEIIFGDEGVTTGASNDIERATELARNMVTKWGFSKKLGPRAYSKEQGEVFLGRSVTNPETTSESGATSIDVEIDDIIRRNYERAEAILRENIDILHAMAQALLKYETIDRNQIDALMERRPVQDPEGWDESKSRSSLVKKEKEAILEEGKPASEKGV